MARVQLEHIFKRYGSVTAVQDFHLTIEDREFLVLVGPSGCGKSTVLRMIAGLEDISDGKMFIGDRLVNDVASKDRNVAMVFQDYALYPHLSVRDNMGFALKMRGAATKEIDEKVNHAAKVLGLEHLLQRKPKELSGGQRQRVAIGRAIVRSPEVFLFDEPLSNLDAKLRVQMRVELAKLHKNLKATMVYVTHDQIEAMTLADRIVVMKDGVVQQVGSPQELYEKPQNAFVGSFIGSPSMNQIKSKLTEENGTKSIVGPHLSISVGNLDISSQEVLLGIRPENLVLTDSENSSVSAQIEVIEPVGSESYLYFSIEGQQWIAKCEGIPAVKEGDQVHFAVDPKKLHIFSNDGATRLG